MLWARYPCKESLSGELSSRTSQELVWCLRGVRLALQGYLADEKVHPPRTLDIGLR